MSLGSQYLCCDDGQFYSCDWLEGKGFAIDFREFREDLLLLPRGERSSGDPSHAPYSDPTTVIEANELPIRSTEFCGYSERGNGRVWDEYAIQWQPGVPFPRRLLPGGWQPKQPKNIHEGTFACWTKRHGEILGKARTTKPEAQ